LTVPKNDDDDEDEQNEDEKNNHEKLSPILKRIKNYQDQFHHPFMIQRTKQNWFDIVDWSSPDRKRREDLEKAKKLDAMLHTPPRILVRDGLVHDIRNYSYIYYQNQNQNRDDEKQQKEGGGGEHDEHFQNANERLAALIIRQNLLREKQRKIQLSKKEKREMSQKSKMSMSVSVLKRSRSDSLRAHAVDDDFAGHAIDVEEIERIQAEEFENQAKNEEEDEEIKKAMNELILEIRAEQEILNSLMMSSAKKIGNATTMTKADQEPTKSAQPIFIAYSSPQKSVLKMMNDDDAQQEKSSSPHLNSKQSKKSWKLEFYQSR